MSEIRSTCPGINKFMRPTPEYFKCPVCEGDVEVWSDENIGICMSCNKEFRQPNRDLSCLDWCDYADKCKEIITARTT